MNFFRWGKKNVPKVQEKSTPVMPSYKCPTCDENINFDPDNLNATAKKCPHCHEWISPKDPWLGLCLNAKRYLKRNSFLFLLPAIFVPAFGVWCLTGSIMWSSIIGAIVLLAVLRPLGIQPAVLISFAAFIFVGVNTLEQKQNFELRNRPYIQIADSSLKIFPTNSYRLNGPKPEPKFLFKLSLANHGPVPASIQEVLIKGHNEVGKVISGESIFIGPNAEDKEKQWKNFDIFPKFSEEMANVWSDDNSFYFNVGDVQKLFGMILDEKEIIKNAQITPESPNLYVSPYLFKQAGKIVSDFFIIIQLEYNALGERNKKSPYYYWVIYKFHSNDNSFTFVESGTDCQLSCKK